MSPVLYNSINHLTMMYYLTQIIHALNQTPYKLDTSIVAGLIGVDNAVDALETIHLYEGRRWAGWYNYPGTISVARKFGTMANSRFWDSVFPGANESPAVTFGLAGTFGPQYIGSFSGTRLLTGYLGYLVAKESLDCPPRKLKLPEKDGSPARKTGSSATVTIISLQEPLTRVTEDTKEIGSFIRINPKSRSDFPLAFWSILPSSINALACVLCFIGKDRLCACLILLGIVSGGLSSLVLGTATLRIRVPMSSEASHPGDGFMALDDGSIIILKGAEGDVNIVTEGQFELDYSTGFLPHQKCHTIGVVSLLLYVQFLVQILFTPFCTLFGQILFLVSFVASGVYHLYVASHEKEMVHRELLSQVVSTEIDRWTLGTRTQMAVFVCLLLGENCGSDTLKYNPDVALMHILPNVNETAVWRYWRKKVLKELERFWDPNSPYPDDPTIKAEPMCETERAEYEQLTSEDRLVLGHLIGDAWCVLKGFPGWRHGES